MTTTLLILVFICIALTFSSKSNTIVVNTEFGLVEGERISNADGADYNIFKAIPYGLPPTRERRFQVPQPPLEWKGIKSARHWPRSCYQFNILQSAGLKKRVKEDEDCLFLGVVAPTTPCPSTGCKAVAYIHGGAFGTGSLNDSLTTAQLFTKEDIVFVSMQYRLGPFGFLTTNDEFAAGNWALWDVLAALKWISRNIRAFNGNPDDVTLMGLEAGATLAGLLTVITEAQTLFKQAIVLGPPPNGKWWTSSAATSQSSRSLSEEDVVQCDLPSTMQNINCLRTTSPTNIVGAFRAISEKIPYGTNVLPFTPNADGYLIKGNFTEMLKIAKPIPLLIVSSSYDTATVFDATKDNFTYGDFMATLRNLINESNYKHPALLRRLALHHYVHTQGDKKDPVLLYNQYKKLMHDVMTVLPRQDEISARLRNDWNNMFHVCIELGTERTLSEVFKSEKRTDEEYDLLKQLMGILVGFIENSTMPTGIKGPTSNRVELGHEDRCILIQGSHKPALRDGFGRGATAFWRNLIPDMERIMNDNENRGKRHKGSLPHDEL